MSAPTRHVNPNGYCLLEVDGHRHVVIGGPFDAFNGGFGVCLEAESFQAANADILIDWPDFGVITKTQFEDLMVRVVEFMMARPEVPVFVGCRGGIGRTGTVIAGLVRALGIDEKDPVGWVRGHYLPHAVETQAQCKLIESFDVKPVRALLAKQEHECNTSTGWFTGLRRLFSWS